MPPSKILGYPVRNIDILIRVTEYTRHLYDTRFADFFNVVVVITQVYYFINTYFSQKIYGFGEIDNMPVRITDDT
jgi:hypothetical protein